MSNLTTGICDDCGFACTAELVDVGIGPYEFWGYQGYNQDIRPLSPCCEAEVVEGGVKLLKSKICVASKDYMKIKKGDKYIRRTYFHWRENGTEWYSTSKIPF